MNAHLKYSLTAASIDEISRKADACLTQQAKRLNRIDMDVLRRVPTRSKA